MNTSNNKRRKASIERIENIFMELLENKELDQVSVSDLCKRAHFNRSTFYANYNDIYDLADKLRRKIEMTFTQLYQEEITQSFNSNDYLKLFRHIRDHQMLYRTYFKLGYDDNYHIIAFDKELAEEHFQNRFIKYHMEFFRAGITHIIKLWLKNGCQESPEDMFEIIKSEYQGRDKVIQRTNV